MTNVRANKRRYGIDAEEPVGVFYRRLGYEINHIAELSVIHRDWSTHTNQKLGRECWVCQLLLCCQSQYRLLGTLMEIVGPDAASLLVPEGEMGVPGTDGRGDMDSVKVDPESTVVTSDVEGKVEIG